MTTPNNVSLVAAEELKSLEDAYIAMLRMPHGAFRARNQYLFCMLLDALAGALDRENEDVQNEYERRSAASGASVPPGYRLVPVELTWEMECAMRAAERTAKACYRAALDAAPSPVKEEENPLSKENALPLLNEDDKEKVASKVVSGKQE